MVCEMMRETEAIQRPADIFGAARRGDRAPHRAEAGEKIGGARHRVEPIHDARPCAFAVALADIGGQRPPAARLHPPLRPLPIIAVIVAPAFVLAAPHSDRGTALVPALICAPLPPVAAPLQLTSS